MTIGHMPTRPQWSKDKDMYQRGQMGDLQSAEDDVLYRTSSEGRECELNHLDPVHVRREWVMTWDGGEAGLRRVQNSGL